jgi:hypothetical protein
MDNADQLVTMADFESLGRQWGIVTARKAAMDFTIHIDRTDEQAIEFSQNYRHAFARHIADELERDGASEKQILACINAWSATHLRLIETHNRTLERLLLLRRPMDPAARRAIRAKLQRQLLTMCDKIGQTDCIEKRQA